MISEKQNIKTSKFLSLVLRHKPETIQIQLDENGWVSVNKLIKKLNNYGKVIDFEILKYVVETNSKKRFAFNEDKSKIRASQGHSLQIDLNYETVNPPNCGFVLNSKFVPLNKFYDKPKVKCLKSATTHIQTVSSNK